MLGREVVTRGLGIYFTAHKWQNTELKHFVGALNEAYLQYGNQALGPDFDLADWSDQWLSTSGVNILEPVVEFAADGSITKLQIKQTCDLRGKNRLRKQKIDAAVFDEHFHPILIKDILLSDKEALNDCVLTFDRPVSAIIINVNDHGYCKVRYDQKTLDSFVDNLQRIQDPVTRAQVWRQLWLLVMDRKMSSVQYFDFVVKQIPYESVDQIIQVALMNLSALVSYYIPHQHVLEKKKIMFETLLNLLANESIEQTTKIPIVDNLFGFLSDLEHLQLAQQWLESGVVFKDQATKKALFTLGTRHKYSILKKVFEEPSISTEFKNALIEKVIGDDKSDIAQNTREQCTALIPEAGTKALVW